MWKLALALAAFACLLIAAPLISSRVRNHRRSMLFVAALVACCAMLIGRSVAPPEVSRIDLEQFRPLEVGGGDDPYASSQSCKDCHLEQFESWHASYHRTMTQIATPTSVMGDFDGVSRTAYGHKIDLSKRGDQFWATMHDPEVSVPTENTIIERPIVMTTGSHHMQVYWYATGQDRRVGQLPIVWLNESKSWAPIHSIFLRPTQTKLGSAEGRWNHTCIKCHATQGRPRIDEQSSSVDTHVAEFGIACEACHGSGAEHAADHRAAREHPVRLVNPQELDHERASEVCGQCHGVWIAGSTEESRRATQNGLSFRPGDVLNTSRHVFSSGQAVSDHVAKHLATDPDFMQDRFWDDGMVRVSGREYNGLIRSPCYKEGSLSCMSCHTMHATGETDLASWANDQLKETHDSNHSCLQCHGEYADTSALENHTHHVADSSGSLCYNCHMPHTTYGLLKAIRSHEISSPSVGETVRVGRPNACNHCHIDRSLAWTARALADWYDMEAPNLTPNQRKYSATLLAAIAGDAGQRALAAWALGWQPAHAASRTDWIAPMLSQLLNDPYHAVRFLAHRSLKSLPGNRNVDLNLVGPQHERIETSRRVLQRWRTSRGNRQHDASLLMTENGDWDFRAFERLLRKRNDRVVVLAE